LQDRSQAANPASHFSNATGLAGKTVPMQYAHVIPVGPVYRSIQTRGDGQTKPNFDCKIESGCAMTFLAPSLQQRNKDLFRALWIDLDDVSFHKDYRICHTVTNL